MKFSRDALAVNNKEFLQIDLTTTDEINAFHTYLKIAPSNPYRPVISIRLFEDKTCRLKFDVVWHPYNYTNTVNALKEINEQLITKKMDLFMTEIKNVL